MIFFIILRNWEIQSRNFRQMFLGWPVCPKQPNRRFSRLHHLSPGFSTWILYHKKCFLRNALLFFSQTFLTPGQQRISRCTSVAQAELLPLTSTSQTSVRWRHISQTFFNLQSNTFAADRTLAGHHLDTWPQISFQVRIKGSNWKPNSILGI